MTRRLGLLRPAVGAVSWGVDRGSFAVTGDAEPPFWREFPSCRGVETCCVVRVRGCNCNTPVPYELLHQSAIKERVALPSAAMPRTLPLPRVPISTWQRKSGRQLVTHRIAMGG